MNQTLKIVSWNCNGVFRKKFEFISELNADIYVIQECENPIETKNDHYINWAENYFWIGDSKNKGLAVFAKPTVKLEKLNWSNHYNHYPVKHFLPCKVNYDFDLLAVWTHRNNSPNFPYIGQFWKYMQLNKDFFDKTIIAGDFNSNAIWDQWDRWWNHTDVVTELFEKGIESVYHKFYNEEKGNESKPTLFFQRNLSKTYHIDYLFASQEFTKNIQHVEIGEVEKWLTFSDHMPLYCEFTL